MCGIVGFIDNKKKDKKENIIKNMALMIKHRGPDSVGYYIDDDIALGHLRLSIIDLQGGDQPIYNENKEKIIIFNGEIYNYKELKNELSKKHIFKTNTDTEVIIHGYEEWGCNLFSKLRGMFAFVIYDKKTQELVGARDHFGIKPFYYYLDKEIFMFASEIKAFLKHPDFKKEVNKNVLKMYLIFQYSVFDETFFKGVFRLNPGCYFKYKDNSLEIKKYFEINFESDNKKYNDYKKELKEIIDESISIHKLTSDVMVGSYLSGGVDSSYVAAKSMPDETFSVGFDIPNNNGLTFNETLYAKDLSNILKIKNYSELISSDDFFDILPTVEYYTDEPHANLSTVPLYFLSKLAKEHVKVVLSGEGADEMFGGYNEYLDNKMVRLYLKLPLCFRKFNAKIAKKFPYFPGKNTIIKNAGKFTERYIGHANVFTSEEANEVLIDSLRDDMETSDILDPYYEKVKDKDDIIKKMYIDYHFWLPKDILLKADKMSMANSIEQRVPFLDKEVFAYARKIPSKYLIKDGQTKYIFRDITSDKLPKEWFSRRKLGFPVPFSKWLKISKYYDLVKKEFNKDYVSEFFDKNKINRMLDDHYNSKDNNGRKIYNIYVFLIWYRVYFIEMD